MSQDGVRSSPGKQVGLTECGYCLFFLRKLHQAPCGSVPEETTYSRKGTEQAVFTQCLLKVLPQWEIGLAGFQCCQ